LGGGSTSIFRRLVVDILTPFSLSLGFDHNCPQYRHPTNIKKKCVSTMPTTCATVQVVSRRLLIAETWVLAAGNHCGIYSGQTGIRTGTSQVLWIYSVRIIPPPLHVHSRIIWEMDNRTVNSPVAQTPRNYNTAKQSHKKVTQNKLPKHHVYKICYIIKWTMFNTVLV
jgi:hypothetical protein